MEWLVQIGGGKQGAETHFTRLEGSDRGFIPRDQSRIFPGISIGNSPEKTISIESMVFARHSHPFERVTTTGPPHNGLCISTVGFEPLM